MTSELLTGVACNYEPEYVEVSGSRSGLERLSKWLLLVESNACIPLEITPNAFFKQAVVQIEIFVQPNQLNIYAVDSVLHIAGDRGPIATLAASIRLLAKSEKSQAGSHIHFEPGADECMAMESWSLVVKLTSPSAD